MRKVTYRDHLGSEILTHFSLGTPSDGNIGYRILGKETALLIQISMHVLKSCIARDRYYRLVGSQLLC